VLDQQAAVEVFHLHVDHDEGAAWGLCLLLLLCLGCALGHEIAPEKVKEALLMDGLLARTGFCDSGPNANIR
jgi:hypothetical protein